MSDKKHIKQIKIIFALDAVAIIAVGIYANICMGGTF